MVEVSYRREMNHNYMIIVSPSGVENGYECRMLAGNCIEGLLKFRIRHQEDRKDFYYEITSKQPLKRLYEQRSMKGNEIRHMLLGIAATLNKVEEYLLREEQILLDPEYIYIEPDQFSVYLCMVPGYSCDFPAAFTGLLEYLLEKVDHKDKDGVVLAYHLYHESLKQNYGMPNLLKYLSKDDGPIFEGESGSELRRYEREQIGRIPIAEKQMVEKQADGEQIDEKQRDAHSEAVNHTAGGRRLKHQPGGTPVAAVRGETSGTAPRKVIEKRNYLEALVIVSKTGATMALGLAVMWFLAGKEAVIRYGGALEAAILVLCLLRGILLRRKIHGQEARALSLAGGEEQGSWKIDFEEQDHNHSFNQPTNYREAGGEAWEYIDSKPEETVEAGEPGTALLADFSGRGRPAILESLSRERESIEISYVPFIIGKHADMTDYCLKQPTISRLHLRIDKREGVYIVTDLNSTNGTTVEGYHLQANETVSIKNGDVVYLADVGFRFMETEG